MKFLLIILAVYFLAGAVMVSMIRRKKDSQKARELWTKYFVYLLLVSLVLGLIWLGCFFALALVMSAAGLLEIINAWRRSAHRKKSLLLAGILCYLPVTAGFLCFAKFAGQDKTIPFLAYSLVVIFDGFSQLFGQLFGKKQMSPQISPAKTWGGFFGGTFFSLVTIFLFWYLESPKHRSLDDFAFALSLLVPVLIIFAFTAVGGDLLASFYKRKCGIKDYANWIPGHGGLLDRFDSFIFVCAVFFVLLVLGGMSMGGYFMI